jgi:pimeloyl-ACP methyl ester carboxylesterase
MKLLPARGDGEDAGKENADASTKDETVKIDRSGLSDVGTDSQPLDYSDRRLWLCRPGNDPDECDRSLDATELLADGSQKATPHVKASDPKYDCFYVYPTVKLSAAGPMTDFSNIDITLDPLLGQGAPFNSLCRVYAPLYRQTGFVPGAASMPTPGDISPTLGVDDVRAAFKYYLEHLNAGRKFVLLGHSQGTGMLMAMMAQDVDPVSDVRAKLISALLIGGNFKVATGKTTGGTFKNIPICTKPGEVGCVIAYSSYAKEGPPGANALFGKSDADQEVACTDPAALAGNKGRYKGTYFLLNLVNKTFAGDGTDALPKLDTARVLYRDVLQGSCVLKDGYSYLEVSLELADDDKRSTPPYRNAATEGLGFGMHVVDYAIALDDLLSAVKMQADAALR